MQLDFVWALAEIGKTVVAGGPFDSAQWAEAQNRKVADEVHAKCEDEIDLTAPSVFLLSVEEMIGTKLLVGDLVVEVLAVSKDLLEEVEGHLGDPLQEESLDLEVVLRVDVSCPCHDRHLVSWRNNLHLRPYDPWVMARGATRLQQMSYYGSSSPHQPLEETVLLGYPENDALEIVAPRKLSKDAMIG